MKGPQKTQCALDVENDAESLADMILGKCSSSVAYDEAESSPYTPLSITVMTHNPCTLRWAGALKLFCQAIIDDSVGVVGLCEARLFEENVFMVVCENGKEVIVATSKVGSLYGAVLNVSLKPAWHSFRLLM